MITTVDSAFVKEQIPSYRVYSDGGAATSYVLMAHKGFVTGLIVVNNTATAGWVQIHDATSLPIDGTVPLLSFPIPSNAAVALDTPIYCATGAVVAISTTRATLTLSSDTALYYANTRK